MADEPVLLDVDPGRFRYSLWRNVSCVVWAGQATLETAQRVRTLSSRIVAQCPGAHSNVVFVLDGTPAPTPEAGAIFAQLFDPRISHMACMAIVLEGAGFWASIIRSTMTSLRLTAKAGPVVGVHDSIDQAVTWLAPLHHERTGVEIEPEELLGAMRSLRLRGASADADDLQQA
jgi:hypothetical protein